MLAEKRGSSLQIFFAGLKGINIKDILQVPVNEIFRSPTRISVELESKAPLSPWPCQTNLKVQNDNQINFYPSERNPTDPDEFNN